MFTLFLMRHAKSCSNHVRSLADAHVDLSQTIRDPGLSVHGEAAARSYAPDLRSRLLAAGMDLRSPHTFVGSSGLRRARDTATLVTDRTPVTVPHFAENGDIPENTPVGADRHQAPDWTAFMRALRATAPRGTTAALVVGHGSFLASQFPNMKKFNNLDGVLIVGRWDGSQFHIVETREIRAPIIHTMTSATSDRCSVQSQENYIQRKLSDTSRKMKHRDSKHRGGEHRGGGVTMPAAWFTPGAQFNGTSAYPTGQGLGATTAQMVRSPIHQTGGRRRRQAGGFQPSVMGSFIQTGSALAPAASYFGYKLFKSKSKKQSRKSRKTRKTRKNRK